MLDRLLFYVYYITCVRVSLFSLIHFFILCASGSVVEHLLAKEGVAGSIPVSRLKKERYQIGIVLFFERWSGLESSMSTLRSGPRSPRSPGPRAPSRAC